jgi:hypothetical protein
MHEYPNEVMPPSYDGAWCESGAQTIAGWSICMLAVAAQTETQSNTSLRFVKQSSMNTRNFLQFRDNQRNLLISTLIEQVL